MNHFDLTPQREALLKLICYIGYGHIQNLKIECGQPVMDPRPRYIRQVKLGRREDTEPRDTERDFLLKASFVNLFDYLDDMNDGEIPLLEIQNGQPFRLNVGR